MDRLNYKLRSRNVGLGWSSGSSKRTSLHAGTVLQHYNPYLCRFINADPSGFSGGLNFYAFADGNPVSMIDPFGLGAVGEGQVYTWIQKNVAWPAEQAVDTAWNLAVATILKPQYGDPNFTIEKFGNPLLRMGAYLPSNSKDSMDSLAAGLSGPTRDLMIATAAVRPESPSYNITQSRQIGTPSGALEPYPMNNGFIASMRVTLPPGTQIDRYGNPNGRFVSPVGGIT